MSQWLQLNSERVMNFSLIEKCEKTLTMFCFFALTISCSSQNTLTLPTGQSSNTENSLAQNSKQPSTTAEKLSLELTPLDSSSPAAKQLKSVENASFVDANLLFVRGTQDSFALTVKNGQLDLSKQQSDPSFAKGKTFLPLRNDGGDFWLVESGSDSTLVIRPIETTSFPTSLPPHQRITLDGKSKVLGFGRDFLILQSKTSLWIVERIGDKITGESVSFPNNSFSPISAGNITGKERTYWIFADQSLWIFSKTATSWTVNQFELTLKNVSGSVRMFSAILESNENSPKFTGPVIALVDEKIALAGLTFDKNNNKSNSGSQSSAGTSTANATPLTAMTFAEASALCNSCHATSSRNKKLMGTERVETWMNENNKKEIISAVSDGRMPSGKTLSDAEKTRFLKFAENPKP